MRYNPRLKNKGEHGNQHPGKDVNGYVILVWFVLLHDPKIQTKEFGYSPMYKQATFRYQARTNRYFPDGIAKVGVCTRLVRVGVLHLQRGIGCLILH